MTLIGEFISTYRVIALPFQDPFCELLVAEQNTPLLLVFFPGVTIETQAEKDEFLQKAPRSLQHNGTTIPLQKLGIASNHPYFAAAYTDETQRVLLDYVKAISQALHTVRGQRPADNRARFSALMGILVPIADRNTKIIPPTPDERTEPILAPNTLSHGARNGPHVNMGPTLAGSRPARAPRKLKRWQQGIIIALLLVLLIGSGALLYTFIPAASATVKVTPVQMSLDENYPITVVENTQSDLMFVVGRSIVVTSQQRTQTVNATGKGVHQATRATGVISLSQIQLTKISPTGNYLAISSVRDPAGRSIVTDEEVKITNGGSVSINAHAEPAGDISNIPAHDIDGPIDIVDAITQVPIGTGYLSNGQGFNGGHDAINYTYVKQADIDNATKALNNQLLAGTMDRVKKSIGKAEKSVQAPQCTPTSSSNHKVDDEVANLTVKLSITCKTLVYTEKMLHDQAVKVYQSHGSERFGSDYGVAGDMIVSQPTTSQSGVFMMSVKGIWTYQYTPDRLEAIKHLIAGKKNQDALVLLNERKDMQKVTLTTAGGIGSAVPTAAKDIKIIINKVTGLQAGSTV
ncbi:hypothetical protein KDA_22310 [Dictyobacter alpinus]|uniref:Baseplate protein J-like domain-containing protein n=1 Tax=Dictyobacter alpinus TaxID=2014873 RepID=A0A402B5Y9_9CHLR|nr:VCBS domain-containing protein [Dictyobacter alpinus]GCE26747.1 hypothetical protein KDA_22310 [Dictyobacter alpinus]